MGEGTDPEAERGELLNPHGEQAVLMSASLLLQSAFLLSSSSSSSSVDKSWTPALHWTTTAACLCWW